MTNAETKRLIALPVALAAVAGLSYAGSQGGAVVGTVPLFSLCASLAVVIQWVAFVPAYFMRTERFCDLTGSLTYLTVTAVAIGLGPSADTRSELVAVLIAVWAVRLGVSLQGWQYVTLVSPVFVTFLLTKVSGIPLLEERADAKWGGDPRYERYKASTPVLVPRPPR